MWRSDRSASNMQDISQSSRSIEPLPAEKISRNEATQEIEIFKSIWTALLFKCIGSSYINSFGAPKVRRHSVIALSAVFPGVFFRKEQHL